MQETSKLDNAELRRAKRREYMRQYLADNPDYAQRKKEQTARRIARRKYWLAKYKIAKGCSECGYAGHHSALDFDHITPSLKSFDVARALSKNSPLKVIIAEVRKCRLLCSNCHRIHTFNQAQGKRIHGRTDASDLH